jgi:PAS domain S-box-containing protein
MRNELAGSPSTDASRDRAFLEGGGAVGALMRTHDWSNSPLGAPETWPQSLRAIVALLLHSKFPMFVAWGPELGFLYNDPYAEILGAKHPLSLGARFHDIWSEIWHDISPLIDAALSGEASYREDLPLVMNRKGYDEQTWFTFSYSPVRDESGRIAGMFCACTETTERKKAEDALRRSRAQIEAELTDTKLLQDLSAQLIREADPKSLYERVMDAAAAIMHADFASMQMFHPERGQAGELRLLTFRGFNPQAAKFWEWVGMDSVGSTCGAALRTGRRVIAPDVEKCDFMAETEHLKMFRRTGIRACQTTPLLSRTGTMVGMISTHWKRPHQPDEHDLRLLDILARQAADLMERNQAEERELALIRDALAATAKFEAVFNQSRIFAGVMDLEGNLREVNDLAVNGCGYTRQQVLDRPFWETPWWRRSEEMKDRIRAATRQARSGTVFRETLRYWVADGSERIVDFAVHPIRDSSGEVIHLHPTGIDITERKQAEETQQLLVAELNHRVKNTLASVQAIVQHTLRRARDPAEFVTSFAGRIQSLSRIHSLLSSTTWQGADLRALIRDQLLAGAVDETRITAWGPPVRLEPQMALHVALMLHELGTNAIKYGALSVPTGIVTISWTVEDTTLRLRWAERGGPDVAAPSTRGFGRTLIEQSAKSDGGDARMSVEAEGVVWNITLPLREPVESYRSKPSASDFVGSGLHQQVSPAERAPARLAGKRFLVIEDEPLVALDIVAALEEAGAVVAGSTGTTDEALHLIESTSLDAALLDANLQSEPVDDIAAALARGNVPFLFVTGYGRESLPRAFASTAMIAKPFSQQQLVDAAARLVEQPADVRRLRE